LKNTALPFMTSSFARNISLIFKFKSESVSVDILKESISILMEFAPKSIDIEKIADEVKKFKEVENIHHIHIWRLGEKDIFLEAHIDFKSNLHLKEVTKTVTKIEKMLQNRFHISHITLQPEFKKEDDKSLIIKKD